MVTISEGKSSDPIISVPLAALSRFVAFVVLIFLFKRMCKDEFTELKWLNFYEKQTGSKSFKGIH